MITPEAWTLVKLFTVNALQLNKLSRLRKTIEKTMWIKNMNVNKKKILMKNIIIFLHGISLKKKKKYEVLYCGVITSCQNLVKFRERRRPKFYWILILVYVLPLILITPWTTMKSRAQKYSFKTVVHLLTINGFIILRNNCPIICVSRNCPVLTRVLRNLKTNELKQIASRCTLHKIDRNVMDTIFKPKIIT